MDLRHSCKRYEMNQKIEKEKEKNKKKRVKGHGATF
jgi:hypothetical protein